MKKLLTILLLVASCAIASATDVGPSFDLAWNAPVGFVADSALIYERVGTAYNLVKTQALPSVPPNQTTLAAVPTGIHFYVGKFKNAGGISVNYSNEVTATVLVLPGTMTNLIFVLGP